MAAVCSVETSVLRQESGEPRMSSSEVHSLRDILRRIQEVAAGKDQIEAGTLMRSFGSRSYGSLLLLPPLLEISPLGAVPGVATTMALLIVLIAGQAVLGRGCVWLPRTIARRSLNSARVCAAAKTLESSATRLDRWFHGRLPSLTQGGAVRIAGAACILLACTVPPLELIPFASTAPMGAIALFGLALLAHDGALMLGAFGAAAGAIAFVAYIMLF
jgi:hypothetical protein